MLRNRKKSKKNRERLKLSYASPTDPPVKRLVINALEIASGRRRIQKYYREITEGSSTKQELWMLAIEKLALKLDFDPEALRKIPQEGPVVFIANHPFGIVDGLILGYLVSLVRTDFFVMVNEVLTRSNPLADALLPIDFRSTKKAMMTNIESRKKAIQRLKAGEALAIFPAGGVATAPVIWGEAQDLSWKVFVAKAIQQSQATVVPIYFEGKNSRLFQVASRLSLSLRLGLFLHEAKNKIGRDILVKIGTPIPFETLQPFKKKGDLLEYLRSMTFKLGDA